MGRLKGLPPRLSVLRPAVGYAPGDAKAADKDRNTLAPWRAWYQTERWRKLRLQVFVRDEYRSQRSGDICAGTYPAPNSPVANHKIPHRGDPKLFWDPNNIETVTKAEHDRLIQAEERALEYRRGTGGEGRS